MWSQLRELTAEQGRVAREQMSRMQGDVKYDGSVGTRLCAHHVLAVPWPDEAGGGIGKRDKGRRERTRKGEE